MLSSLCNAIHQTSINVLGEERGEGDFERGGEVKREMEERRDSNVRRIGE